jgi:hypothetical protein
MGAYRTGASDMLLGDYGFPIHVSGLDSSMILHLQGL